MFLIDRFGRPLTKLRISVTDKCNLKCFYCHEEGLEKSQYEALPEEFELLVRIFSKFGINSVKLTGGEPLVRNDIVEIVHRISCVKWIKDLSITTNGQLLSEYARDLKKNGLNRVNINLPTIDREKYRKITGGGNVEKVIEGTMEAKNAGLYPIKLNMVLLKGINEEDVEDMINFSIKNGFILQIIELEPLGKAADKDFFEKYHVSLLKVKEQLRKKAVKIETRSFQKRTVYYMKKGIIEIVDPLENTDFCFHCTRIRVTPDLKLKPCLMRNDNLVQIKRPLTEETIREAILEANRRREPYFTVSS